MDLIDVLATVCVSINLSILDFKYTVAIIEDGYKQL